MKYRTREASRKNCEGVMYGKLTLPGRSGEGFYSEGHSGARSLWDGAHDAKQELT